MAAEPRQGGTRLGSAALEKGRLDRVGYAEMLAKTTRLNDIGIELAEVPGVHAMTDVTGFGLLVSCAPAELKKRSP